MNPLLLTSLGVQIYVTVVHGVLPVIERPGNTSVLTIPVK